MSPEVDGVDISPQYTMKSDMTSITNYVTHNFIFLTVYFKTYVIVFTERYTLPLDFQNLVSGVHAFQEKRISLLLSYVMTNQN